MLNFPEIFFYFLHLKPETSSVSGSIRTKPAMHVFLNCPNVWCSLTAQQTHPLGSSGSAIFWGTQLSLQDTADMRALSPIVQLNLKRCSSKRGFPDIRNRDWFLKEIKHLRAIFWKLTWKSTGLQVLLIGCKGTSTLVIFLSNVLLPRYSSTCIVIPKTLRLLGYEVFKKHIK